MNKDTVKWNGNRYDFREDTTLNELQRMHIDGEIDLYLPLEAYYEEYDKKGKAVPGTRVRKDLPSIAEQWKMDCQRRLTNG